MKVLVSGDHFVDEEGNQLLFNGINTVCKDPEHGYLFPDMEPVFQRFHKQGFNLIRLGISWDGVEPQPGVYDEAYLGRVKDMVELAWRYGLYTMLDMHQDLFSRKWDNGAPLWATLDDGFPHPDSCTMWYEAYLQSEAVIRAADNFWKNAPAEDGAGLLDHYEAMWEMLAAYFDSCESIIGYEPMNEPFMGGLAREAFGQAAAQTAARFADYDPANPLAMTAEQGAYYMGVVSEKLMGFDRDTLMPFYRRMQRAVARVSDKPLITGGNIYSSSTIPTGITRLDARGNQIYAPHGYDAVVDSDRYESFNKGNVEALFADKRRSQLALNLPTIIGEWGAFPSKPFTNDLIRHMNGILEQNLWSSTYWLWQPGLENDPNYSELSRAYPMVTAGELHSYHYDPEKKTLSLCYEARENGTTVIYCPFRPEGIGGTVAANVRIEAISDDACLVFLEAVRSGIIDLILS